MAYDIPKSSSGTPLLFFITQTADHITGLTGASPTVTISKNGAAFGSPAGVVTEISSGWYKVAGNATDSNTAGPLALHAIVASGDPCDILVANIIDPTAAVYGVNVVQENQVSNAAITTIKAVQGLTTADTIATYTGNTPQTGDAFTRIGVAGIGLTNLGDTRLANLDAAVSTRMATFTIPANFASLGISAAGNVNADTKKMNGTTVNGTGAAGDLWRG